MLLSSVSVRDHSIQGPTPGTGANNLVPVAGRNPQPDVSLYGLAQQPLNATAYTKQKYGYVEQWNFGIQRELPGGFFADVAYAGSHGVHLEQFNTNVNQIPDSFINQAQQQFNAGQPVTIAQPVAAYPFSVNLPGTLQPGKLTQGQLDRPFPQYAGLQYNGFGCCGSSYNSLQATVTKRFNGGGTLLVAYTNAKLLSNTDTLTSWLEGGTSGGVGSIQDWNNLKGERSISSQDVSQRMVVSYVLDLPFGRGKKYLAGVSGVTSKVVSGWGIDGITTFQRGFPVKISYGKGNALSGAGLGIGSLRPNVVSGWATSPWDCGTTSGTPRRRAPSVRSSIPRSTWASPISTWPTTTGRRPAARRSTSDASCVRTSRHTGTSSSSPARPAGTCGRVRTARAAGHASTCSPASTRASDGSASTTSTSSIPIASTSTHPLEETMGALVSAVRAGKALYVGISSYSATKTREAAAILRAEGVPLLIHQPSYNLLNRWVEPELLDALDAVGAGMIAFTALAQGLLTDKYLEGIPADSRINRPGGDSLSREMLSQANLARVRSLNDIALRRGQSLAQMAYAWVLRDPRVTTTLMGASSAAQVRENVGALGNLAFTPDELAEIDRYAVDSGVNLWEKPSTDQRV